ncbi:MAG: S8 family serine peptidase [Nanoarchaeota archaeon]|nr:S8 family serine peptidase [Nanoarchaeota archaeon]
MDLEKIITSRDAKPEQIEEWLRIYRDDTRIPVVIIDSGFDTTHETITHKIWRNPKEKLNGIDDDGNGWIDDIMGWHRNVSKYLGIDIDSPNIHETIILRPQQPPISHGTHVASIALKNLDKFALVGFAGDMSHPDYLKRIGLFLKDHNIPFANMSFSYGNKRSPFAPESESFYELGTLIKENPQTLIVIAAGNQGMDLDLSEFKTYPPSFDYKNLLVVGALDTDDIIESELPNYKPVEFSDRGSETVDVFAPGVKVPGALVGAGILPMSGTSMASPYALNVVLSVYEENPNLTALEIKEIVIKTAYVPDKPLPCVSGGIIYPKRMLSVARLLAKNPSLTIDEAVSQIFKLEQ